MAIGYKDTVYTGIGYKDTVYTGIGYKDIIYSPDTGFSMSWTVLVRTNSADRRRVDADHTTWNPSDLTFTYNGENYEVGSRPNYRANGTTFNLTILSTNPNAVQLPQTLMINTGVHTLLGTSDKVRAGTSRGERFFSYSWSGLTPPGWVNNTTYTITITIPG